MGNLTFSPVVLHNTLLYVLYASQALGFFSIFFLSPLRFKEYNYCYI